MLKLLFNFFSLLFIANLSASNGLDSSSSWDSSSEWWNTGWDSGSGWDSNWNQDSSSASEWDSNSGWGNNSWDSSSGWDSSPGFDSGWNSSIEAVQMSGMDVMQNIFSHYYAGFYTEFLSELDTRWETLHGYSDSDSSGYRAGSIRYDLENIRSERNRSLEEIVTKHPNTNVARVLQEVLGYSLGESEMEHLQYFMFDRAIQKDDCHDSYADEWIRFLDLLYEFRSKHQILQSDFDSNSITLPTFHTYAIVVELQKRNRIMNEFSGCECPLIESLSEIDPLLMKFYANQYNWGTVEALANGKISPMNSAEVEVQVAMRNFNESFGNLINIVRHG